FVEPAPELLGVGSSETHRALVRVSTWAVDSGAVSCTNRSATYSARSTSVPFNQRTGVCVAVVVRVAATAADPADGPDPVLVGRERCDDVTLAQLLPLRLVRTLCGDEEFGAVRLLECVRVVGCDPDLGRGLRDDGVVALVVHLSRVFGDAADPCVPV